MIKQAKKILIVEDEKSLSMALELKLSNSGFETKTASNGEQALELLKENKFNLVLLDLIMPNISGFDVLEEMFSRKDKTPVIVLSNLGQKEDLERVKKLGVKKYFIKSNINISEIVDYIKNNLK